MYKSLVSKTIIILFCFLIILALSLPILLKSLGLHPDFDSKTFELNGKKALIITSSHDVLNLPGEVRGKPTGVASSELTIPYYEFMNSGMDVDLASIKGGEIPIDPETLIYLIRPATVNEVFHLPSTLLLSAKKNTVAAAIAAVTSQKETPTKSSASRSPPEAANRGAAIMLDRINKDFIFLSRYLCISSTNAI